MNWEACSAVERNPRKISGAWAFTGTRVPVLRPVRKPRERRHREAVPGVVPGGKAVASGSYS